MTGNYKDILSKYFGDIESTGRRTREEHQQRYGCWRIGVNSDFKLRENKAVQP